MQVYRGLDIGTAKPSAEDRTRIPHHLIDVAEVDEPYHAGRFREEAGRAIREIRARGAVPIVAGGTVLYLKALLQGLAEAPGRDPEIRRGLEARWAEGEAAALWEELSHVDPDLARRLHPNDRTRVIRALEVWAATGQPLSAFQARHGFSERPYEFLMLGMAVEREILYPRIDERVSQMLEAGWADEVRGLLRRGCSPELAPLQAIGYREICATLLRGEPPDGAVAEIRRETRRFAKRQLTWFRRMEIEWVDPRDPARGVQLAKKFLQNSPAPI
jgi:tRNA dimethylallyltransferase